ncbi:MAG: transketolase [Thermodesulfobacteriota bacterium]
MLTKGEARSDFTPLDELCVNTLRFLAVDGVQKAASGHPGMPMGDAPMAHVLWSRHLRFNPANPLWPGRDRFVLSAGHGSMLLYGLLHLSGYPISLDDLKNFRQWGSPTAGHPEYNPALGIETTTGPLGQGFATGVGMAMAERYLAERYNRPGFKLFDYNIYAICGDGDMMEGVTYEAASTAGHLGLGNLIYLYSDNRITIEGSTDIAFTEDVAARFIALGWHVQKVDGNNMAEVDGAIEKAKQEREKPSIIVARTNIGFGSPSKQDAASAHGAPLGAEEVKKTKEKLGWPLEPAFFVPEEVAAEYGTAKAFGEGLEAKWQETFKSYREKHPELAGELAALLKGEFNSDWKEDLPEFSADDGSVATRKASGAVLNAISKKTPYLLGGSADLAPSTNTMLNGFPDFTPETAGRNLHFGVREHAMGAILNGMAESNALLPYGATFLVFSDYMRPAIRLAALMKLHLVYVFTHDSIGLGEDGPTHQPVEQLASLRAIPGLTVLRPADAAETVEAWKAALERKKGPVALILTRQGLPVIDRDTCAPAAGVQRGGYVLLDPVEGDPSMILMATGSEVTLVLNAAAELAERGIKTRVVSMPSWEIFEEQNEAYRHSVLPPSIKARLAVEAGVTQGWSHYVGSEGAVIGIDRFGASAPYKEIFEHLGLTVSNVVARALALAEAVR